MNRLGALILLSLTILTHITALGADWKFLQKNDKGEFFYDAENLVPSSEKTIGVWVKVVYSDEFKGQEGLKDLHHTMGFWEMDCKNKKIRLLLSSHFSEERQEEIPLPPRVFTTPDWEPVPSHTVLEELYRLICKPTNQIDLTFNIDQSTKKLYSYLRCPCSSGG